jgi:hypothetical protein
MASAIGGETLDYLWSAITHARATKGGDPSYRWPCGGRTWWAHLEFTRRNIELTILKKDIEETVGIGPTNAKPNISRDVLEVRAFSGR